jgi:hypothetical protein
MQQYAVKLGWVFLLLGLLNAANASTITFQFSGTVTQVPLDEVFGDIAVGDQILGNASFDSNAVDQIPADPATGSYTAAAPFGITVTIGKHNFDATNFLNIGILNGFVDQYTALATDASGDLTVELFLQDNTGTVFNNDHLPSSLPPLTAFTQRDFHLDALFAGGEIQVDGLLGDVPVQAVPEPSPVGPVLTCSVLLLALARRRILSK